MGSGPRWLLIAAIVLLGLGEWAWGIHSATSRLTARIHAEQVRRHAHPPLPLAKGHLFTHDETHAFLAAAKRAEAIEDPLQRCLFYPDPPDSHWSHDAVVAYCHYRLRSVISFAEVQALIQHGHAADLDRLMAQALDKQQTQKESAGLLDQIFYQDFDDGSFDIRPTLDAWKRDSPKSAFAYAASGFAYVAMAASARGNAYISETPQSNVDAMDKLLSQADTDLRRAIELNPKVTPAYVAMIDAGKMSLGRAYIDQAARRGLAAAPADYSIYNALMMADQPKWGGSLLAMARLARSAQAHVGNNPLLTLLLAEAPAYAYDVCDCESRAVWAADSAVFDNLASSTLLKNAGYAATRNGHSELSVVYLSEASRFLPDNIDVRVHRNYDLTTLRESAWALADANQLVDTWPEKAGGFNARAYAYESIKDYVHAEQDLRTAIPLDASDTWPLAELGDIYVYRIHDWDKGWDIASRLIQSHPEKPQGWILRASIQKDQPRAGMDETMHYFLAHFGDDPHLQLQVREMHAALAKEAAASRPAAAATTPAHQ
ncbi:tetratricopeptide repeat protein [Rhodanobacter terrae]|uniref:Tetratricopeptide repeat protein n=1 Tax=Rhodanobacter terrae TaxID=418647 RepID=A0ABW0SSR6_9GAMM